MFGLYAVIIYTYYAVIIYKYIYVYIQTNKHTYVRTHQLYTYIHARREGGIGSLFRGFGPYAVINAAKWSTSMAVYNTVREYYGQAPSNAAH